MSLFVLYPFKDSCRLIFWRSKNNCREPCYCWWFPFCRISAYFLSARPCCEKPDWPRACNSAHAQTTIFVWRSCDVMLHDGCQDILIAIKMVACDVRDPSNQSEKGKWSKLLYGASRSEGNCVRANETLCCRYWLDTEFPGLDWDDGLDVYDQGGALSCARSAGKRHGYEVQECVTWGAQLWVPDLKLRQTPTFVRNAFLKTCTKVKMYESRAAHFRVMKGEIKDILSSSTINPLNPELNPICYLLVLLGAHHFLHVSRIRVKSLTLRLLMSYIYGAPIRDVSRSHTTTQHSR